MVCGLQYVTRPPRSPKHQYFGQWSSGSSKHFSGSYSDRNPREKKTNKQKKYCKHTYMATLDCVLNTHTHIDTPTDSCTFIHTSSSWRWVVWNVTHVHMDEESCTAYRSQWLHNTPQHYATLMGGGCGRDDHLTAASSWRGPTVGVNMQLIAACYQPAEKPAVCLPVPWHCYETWWLIRQLNYPEHIMKSRPQWLMISVFFFFFFKFYYKFTLASRQAVYRWNPHSVSLSL